MMRYLKLTNFELNRFFKIYVVLIGITLIMQLIGVVFISNNYIGDIEKLISEGNSVEQALMGWGIFSFSIISRSLWFTAPISLCVVTLLIYVFFIWYRDWFGKNTFAYRLLMLPTARINVFFAKATAIFLMVLGLVAIQLIFIMIENEVMKLIVPSQLREDLTLNEILYGFDSLRVLYPTSFIQFFIHYGIGLMTVLVAFTGVLFERCFRWKGIILGVVFAVLSFFVFISPLLIQEFLVEGFFYPTEIFILMVVAALIVTSGAIWMSHYLLNKKIRV